jgi:hypothetical protein
VRGPGPLNHDSSEETGSVRGREETADINVLSPVVDAMAWEGE